MLIQQKFHTKQASIALEFQKLFLLQEHQALSLQTHPTRCFQIKLLDQEVDVEELGKTHDASHKEKHP